MENKMIRIDKSEGGDKGERKSFSSRRDDRDRGGGDEGGEKSSFTRRRRGRPPVDATYDYKDLETLRQHIGDDGKIIPARITRLNRHQQRQLTIAVKRARQLALLPVSPLHNG